MVTTHALAWTPLTERFGAEVDIDLNSDLSESVTEQIRQLLDERQLLVFRKQAISYETQRRAVSIVGNPLTEVKYVSSAHDSHGGALDEPVDPGGSATTWFHSDLVWLPAMPIWGISLYAEDVSGNTSPSFQGTRFLSTRNAYLDLPMSVQSELEGRTAFQIWDMEVSMRDPTGLMPLSIDEVKSKGSFWAEHPLFCPNPRTGKRVLLYMPWFTHSIVGMSRAESREWFDRFDALLYQNSEVYTHRWQQDDVAIWDNLALQHCKESVKQASVTVPTRVLRRVAFGPEEPEIF